MSGEGSSIEGGRFNAKGIATLYTSLTSEVAWLESTPLGYNLQPRILCAYEADIEPIFDATDSQALISKGTSETELQNSEWKREALEGTVSITQGLANRLIEDGFAGMLVRSFVRGATKNMLNLVLWKWGPDLPHKITLIDDERVLDGLRR